MAPFFLSVCHERPLLQLLYLVAGDAVYFRLAAEISFGIFQGFLRGNADGNAVQVGIVVEDFRTVCADGTAQGVNVVAVIINDEVVRGRRRVCGGSIGGGWRGLAGGEGQGSDERVVSRWVVMGNLWCRTDCSASVVAVIRRV